MNICHVNLASGYHGGENQTLQLIKEQIRLDYTLTVVANPKSPFFSAVTALDCNVIASSHFLATHQRSITQHCDLIHVHEGKAIYWALIQHWLYKIPYIITRRIDNPLKKKWLANLAYNNAHHIVGLSRVIVEKIHQAYPTQKVSKIPSSPVSYAINDAKLEQVKQQFKGKFVIIHAANMLSHKGFDVTVDAAKILQSHANIHFCLLGDGEQRSMLEQQASSLKNVSFMGKQSSMGEWFAMANLQVHPSYSEGLGSVILEGMAAKLPIIATNAGGIPDIIDHEQNGLLIEPGDATALAEGILRISDDPQLRQQFIDHGQEKLKTFHIEHTAQRYQQLYQEVISTCKK